MDLGLALSLVGRVVRELLLEAPSPSRLLLLLLARPGRRPHAAGRRPHAPSPAAGRRGVHRACPARAVPVHVIRAARPTGPVPLRRRELVAAPLRGRAVARGGAVVREPGHEVEVFLLLRLVADHQREEVRLPRLDEGGGGTALSV